jgi:hypothetical protein
MRKRFEARQQRGESKRSVQARIPAVSPNDLERFVLALRGEDDHPSLESGLAQPLQLQEPFGAGQIRNDDHRTVGPVRQANTCSIFREGEIHAKAVARELLGQATAELDFGVEHQHRRCGSGRSHRVQRCRSGYHLAAPARPSMTAILDGSLKDPQTGGSCINIQKGTHGVRLGLA